MAFDLVGSKGYTRHPFSDFGFFPGASFLLLTLLFCYCDRHYDQKHLWGKGFISTYIPRTQPTFGGSQAGTVEEHCLLACFVSLG